MAKTIKRSPRIGIFILLAVLLGAGGGYLRYIRIHGAPEFPWVAGKGGSPAATPGEEGKSSAELFFSSAEGTALVPRRRVLPAAADTLARCRVIIDELKRAPGEGLVSLLPVEFEVRSLFVDNSILVVDLQPRIREVQAGVFQELLMWYSLVDSVIMNVKDIGAVQFIVDGQEVDSILGHLDMRGPFAERLDLVRWD